MFVLADLLDMERVMYDRPYHFSNPRELNDKIGELIKKYEGEGKEVKVTCPTRGYFVLEEKK